MSTKMAVFWDVAPCSQMTDAVSTSETSVSFYQTTRRNLPEDSHIFTNKVTDQQTNEMPN
jgi:hypothetical protein